MVIKKKKPLAKKKAITVGNRESSRDVEIPVTDNKEIQDGNSPRSKLGGGAHPGLAVVGIGKGITLNMGDYQSARIDVFIQRTVEDDNEVIQATILEIDELLQEEIERQSELLE